MNTLPTHPLTRRFAALITIILFSVILFSNPAVAQVAELNVCGTRFALLLKRLISLGIAAGMIGSTIFAIFQHARHAMGRGGAENRNQAIAGIIITPLLAFFLKALIVNILGYYYLACLFPF